MEEDSGIPGVGNKNLIVGFGAGASLPAPKLPPVIASVAKQSPERVALRLCH
ncbi:hypothetical protein SAMN02787100_1291 [Chryseobacterium sp. OV279]|nr:hypothetical protein SAMN02787100_1291 [Chryseobacterium sp. OV279]